MKGAFLSLILCAGAAVEMPAQLRADAPAESNGAPAAKAQSASSTTTTITTTTAAQIAADTARAETVRALLETRPLNPESVELIPTDAAMTTTVIFPEPIDALDGAGFSIDPNQHGALFNLSFSEGASYFSLHALKAGARANLNVFSRGRCYVLLFVEERGAGLFRVNFSREEPKYPKPFPPPQKRDLMVSPARLLGLLDKCKAYHLLCGQHPEVVDDLRVYYPAKVTQNDGFSVTLNAVYRKDGWDSLVFECELENAGAEPVYYNPEGFSARVNSLVYHQSLADAGGVIPAKGQVQAWFLISGDDAGGSNSLDPANTWEITLERVEGSTAAPAAAASSTTTTSTAAKSKADFKSTTK